MLTIEIEPQDASIMNELVESYPESVSLVKQKRFDGSPDLVQAVVTLSLQILPLLGSIIITYIQSKKHITLKYKGVVITGVSEETVKSILQDLLEKEKKSKK